MLDYNIEDDCLKALQWYYGCDEVGAKHHYEKENIQHKIFIIQLYNEKFHGENK